jgi:hypothetical protein
MKLDTTASLSAILSIIFGALALAFGLSILLAFPVKWLWNSTVTELFNFPVISVWMAWKLSFLSALLFKSYSTRSK